MKAFADWKFCPTALIRVGVDCDQYGRCYEYTVLLVIPWMQFFRKHLGLKARGIVEGMVSPDAMPVRPEHLFAITSAVKREGYRPEWTRLVGGKPRGKNFNE